MNNKLPRVLPPLSFILADLGHPHPTTIARVLDMDVRTVRRWIKADHAPRPAALALYWLTSYGFDAIDCDLSDRLRLWGSMVDSYSRELMRTRYELAELKARLSSAPGRWHQAGNASAVLKRPARGGSFGLVTCAS